MRGIRGSSHSILLWPQRPGGAGVAAVVAEDEGFASSWREAGGLRRRRRGIACLGCSRGDADVAATFDVCLDSEAHDPDEHVREALGETKMSHPDGTEVRGDLELDD